MLIVLIIFNFDHVTGLPSFNFVHVTGLPSFNFVHVTGLPSFNFDHVTGLPSFNFDHVTGLLSVKNSCCICWQNPIKKCMGDIIACSGIQYK